MTPLRLVQYWDSGNPPREVAALMATWADDPAFAYRAYSRDQAVAYIAAHYPARMSEAFAQCRYGAMQADFLRYCVLLEEGGLYIDADTANEGGVPAMIEGSGRGCLMTRRGSVANDFIYIRSPGDPLIAKVLDQAVANIEGRVSNNVWKVTGPGIMTKLWKDPAMAPLFEGFRVMPVTDVGRSVTFRWDLSYKNTSDDWREANRDASKSIFQ